MKRSILVFVWLAGGCGGQAATAAPASAPPSEAPAALETTDAAATADATEATDAADASAAASVSAGPALEGALVDLARTSDSATKMEIVVDGTGAIVKQALYHKDADAVPEAVRKLADDKFPGHKLISYELEKYPDGLVYEVEVKTKAGKECEIAAKDDGTEVYTECHIKKSELSKPIADKVKELHPKAKIIEAETKKGPNFDIVSVEVAEGGREYSLEFAADGTLKRRFRKLPAELELEID